MTDLPRCGGRATLLAAAVAALATAPTPAAAAPPRAQDRNTTDGVDRVYHDYSAEGDASSLELNPALLSSMRGLDITLLGYRTVSEFARGSGFGGWFGWGLPFGVATSFGVQVMAPRLGLEIADFDAASNPAATKISWGLSARAGETAAIGFGIHGIRVAGQWLQRPDLDVGTLFRIFNYGSIGVAARLSPVELSTDIYPAHLSLTGEVSVRPLGTHHLELAGGVTQRVASGGIGDPVESQGVSALFPRGRIALRYQGLALKGEVEQVSASVLDPVSFDRLRGEKAWRGAVSVEAAWDFMRVGAGVHAGLSEGLDGVGVMARFSTRKQGRVFWPRRVDAERIDLSSVKDERDFIGILQRLERARKAGKRAVLVVDARGTRLGWASVHEVRDALVRVRNAGGHVFSYVENASLKDYFLATAGEKIYIHPAGGLSIFGMASTSIYLRGALDKLGVNVEVVKVDEYKSAGEQFTNVEPSKYDREQRTELMADMYTQVVYDVARARGRSLSDVRSFFDEAPYDPEQTVELGLADGVVFRDELLPEISEAIGAEVEIHEFTDSSPHETWAKAPYVAVVLVEGAIVDGKSRRIPFIGTGFAGGDTIARDPPRPAGGQGVPRCGAAGQQPRRLGAGVGHHLARGAAHGRGPRSRPEVRPADRGVDGRRGGQRRLLRVDGRALRARGPDDDHGLDRRHQHALRRVGPARQARHLDDDVQGGQERGHRQPVVGVHRRPARSNRALDPADLRAVHLAGGRGAGHDRGEGQRARARARVVGRRRQGQRSGRRARRAARGDRRGAAAGGHPPSGASSRCGCCPRSRGCSI